jgi:tripartite-type tricarboxylate transporter receptor subunit TctC
MEISYLDNSEFKRFMEEDTKRIVNLLKEIGKLE